MRMVFSGYFAGTSSPAAKAALVTAVTHASMLASNIFFIIAATLLFVRGLDAGRANQCPPLRDFRLDYAAELRRGIGDRHITLRRQFRFNVRGAHRGGDVALDLVDDGRRRSARRQDA